MIRCKWFSRKGHIASHYHINNMNIKSYSVLNISQFCRDSSKAMFVKIGRIWQKFLTKTLN